MEGYIVGLQTDKGYGFIKGNDRNDYFFHAKSLVNAEFFELEKNDKVSFEPSISDDNKKQAIQVYKEFFDYSSLQIEPTQTEVKPGIHKLVKLTSFSEEEQTIIENLSKYFFVTNAEHIRLGYSSVYSYCLLKPIGNTKILFNLNREIIVILSSYVKFEPRIFDAVSQVHKKIQQQLRLDRMCSVVISKSSDAKNEALNLLRTATEMQVIIPFSFDEIINNCSETLIISRFRECFFERDLFAIESPLKEDIHFFGRRTYVNQLISRHSSGENSGVFGLRRSGKSSVLQAIKRASELINTTCIIEDCQDLYHSRWNNALYDVMKKIVESTSFEIKINRDDYSEELASVTFANQLGVILSADNSPNILLMFDEIEWISPNSSPEEYWNSGNDFIMFWQVIRKNFNQYGNQFTFILAGTNPSAIEKITINGYDNPLFNQIKSDSYLPSFTVEDTSDMVNKLGGYMGLHFDSIVCSKLTQDFGGHPYLIRHFCSAINDYIQNETTVKKPLTVTPAIYDKVMPLFIKNHADNYCSLIMEVLTKNYPEEYKYLEDFALGNITDNDLDNINSQLLSHLMGYNILENNNGIYGFKIDVLKNHLVHKCSYKKRNMSQEEKYAEISERRNKIEIKLRKLVKMFLKAQLGEQEAKKRVIKSMQPQYKELYAKKKYDELFDPKSSDIYFSQLKLLIEKNWDDCFKNVFSKNRNTISHYLGNINYHRADCHATEITDDDMIEFRNSASGIEKELSDIFDM